jgi:hypothetical protein
MAIVAIATSRHNNGYMHAQSRTHVAVAMVVTSKKHLELKVCTHMSHTTDINVIRNIFFSYLDN